MKKIIELLNDELKAAFSACGYDEKYAKVVVSNRPDLCQYQCNGCMAAAKEYKKAPAIIAGEIVEKLAESSTFSKVEAVRTIHQVPLLRIAFPVPSHYIDTRPHGFQALLKYHQTHSFPSFSQG